MTQKCLKVIIKPCMKTVHNGDGGSIYLLNNDVSIIYVRMNYDKYIFLRLYH